jgi:hypothetical protein
MGSAEERGETGGNELGSPREVYIGLGAEMRVHHFCRTRGAPMPRIADTCPWVKW